MTAAVRLHVPQHIDGEIVAGSIRPDEMSGEFLFAVGGSRDRYGDLLEIGGIHTEYHRKNPIALLDHGKNPNFPLAIGKCLSPDGTYTVFLNPHAQTAIARIFFSQSYPLARQLFLLYQEGMLRGGSIGYRTIRYAKLPADPTRGFPVANHLIETELLEVSVTCLPVHQDAVKSILGRGRVGGDPLDTSLRAYLEPLAGPPVVSVVGGYKAMHAPPVVPAPANTGATAAIAGPGQKVIEPIGAQLFRKLHKDCESLIQDYENFHAALDKCQAKTVLEWVLDVIDTVCETVAEEFRDEYPDLSPLKRTEEIEKELATHMGKAYLPTAKRANLPDSDFAWPERRKYPIPDQAHLDAAIKLIGRAPSSKQRGIKQRIIAIAAKKKLALPEAWGGKAMSAVAESTGGTLVHPHGHAEHQCSAGCKEHGAHPIYKTASGAQKFFGELVNHLPEGLREKCMSHCKGLGAVVGAGLGGAVAGPIGAAVGGAVGGAVDGDGKAADPQKEHTAHVESQPRQKPPSTSYYGANTTPEGAPSDRNPSAPKFSEKCYPEGTKLTEEHKALLSGAMDFCKEAMGTDGLSETHRIALDHYFKALSDIHNPSGPLEAKFEGKSIAPSPEATAELQLSPEDIARADQALDALLNRLNQVKSALVVA